MSILLQAVIVYLSIGVGFRLALESGMDAGFYVVRTPRRAWACGFLVDVVLWPVSLIYGLLLNTDPIRKEIK